MTEVEVEWRAWRLKKVQAERRYPPPEPFDWAGYREGQEERAAKRVRVWREGRRIKERMMRRRTSG